MKILTLNMRMFRFQSDQDDNKKVLDHTLIIGAICWKDSKQDTLAYSVSDVEYIVAYDAAM